MSLKLTIFLDTYRGHSQIRHLTKLTVR